LGRGWVGDESETNTLRNFHFPTKGTRRRLEKDQPPLQQSCDNILKVKKSPGEAASNSIPHYYPIKRATKKSWGQDPRARSNLGKKVAKIGHQPSSCKKMKAKKRPRHLSTLNSKKIEKKSRKPGGTLSGTLNTKKTLGGGRGGRTSASKKGKRARGDTGGKIGKPQS